MNAAMEITPWAVPLGFFACIALVVFAVMYFRTRQEAEKQKSIQSMVAKGMQVPIELIIKPERHSKLRDQKTGLLLIGTGLAVIIAMLITEPGSRDWAWGFVPVAIGIAFLISAKLSSSSDDDKK